VASEGGHADWAPQSELQQGLWRFLAAEVSHVSVERVLSGPGLHNIYRFLRDGQGLVEPPWLAEAIRADGPAPAIATAGLAGRAEICVRALELLIAIYGAEAGNLGLRMLATAGVYLGGGIAPRLLPALRSRTFLDAFAAKGRVRALLETVPVRVVLNDRAALIGAARRAAIEAGLLD
jgi:glucokinase